MRLPEHSGATGVAVAERFGALGPSVFVALFGSSFDARPTGGEVVRVPLIDGKPAAQYARFARDFGRQEPLGLAIGPDGDLYVSLWTSGRVVAISAPTRPATGGGERGAPGPVGAAITAAARRWRRPLGL